MNLRVKESPAWVWDAAVVGVGLLVISATLRLYRYYSLPSFSHASHPPLSSSEADRQIESTQAYLATHPEDFNALMTLSMAYYQKGPESYVNAMNALEKARALGATDDHLFYYAGVMYDALGLPEYAVNELSKYLRHHPDDYEAQIRLANLYVHQKQWDKAQALYKQAIEEWPKDPTVLFNSAIVNKETGHYPEALSALNQVRKVSGRLPEGGLFEEGEIFRLQGKEDQALHEYQEELASSPDFVPALEAEESILRRRGDMKPAKALRQQINDLKKKGTPATKTTS